MSDLSGIKHFDVVHVQDEFRPEGPAENSIIILSNYQNGEVLAKYIPWVGYFDLDIQKLLDPNWEIIEPRIDYSRSNVTWVPFEGED